MKKKELIDAVDKNIADTQTALQTIWNKIPKGQQKQIRKVEECAALLDRYEIHD